jgi:hypothetical protein
VLFAEAVLEARRIGDPSYSTGGQVASAAVLVVLGLAISLLITPTWRRRGLVLLFSLPLTTVGFVLLSLTGFR